jgi:hypothetical protein
MAVAIGGAAGYGLLEGLGLLLAALGLGGIVLTEAAKKADDVDDAAEEEDAGEAAQPCVKCGDCKNVNCDRVKKKIENIKRDIEKRSGELYDNENNLPWGSPGDPDWSTVRGHVKILNMLKATLAKWKGIYTACCGGNYNDL